LKETLGAVGALQMTAKVVFSISCKGRTANVRCDLAVWFHEPQQAADEQSHRRIHPLPDRP
jgi:hypothetical protein